MLAGLVLVAGLSLAASLRPAGTDVADRAPERAARDREVRIVLEGRTEAVVRPADGIQTVAGVLARELPPTRTVETGSATVTYRPDVRGTARLAITTNRAAVQVVRRPVTSRIEAPVIAQKLRNNCETAALSVLLATRGVQAGQLDLQDDLPRSGPLDPDDSGAQRVWGDPERGYVGRADGGGVAGGFGTYQRPVAALARRRGVTLRDLTGQPSAVVYERVRAGRAVMVWIGLSEGPYGSWRSPTGRDVKVNFGEHTVVLTGIRADGRLRVVNPLEGTVELWTQQRFEALWARLGERALST